MTDDKPKKGRGRPRKINSESKQKIDNENENEVNENKYLRLAPPVKVNLEPEFSNIINDCIEAPNSKGRYSVWILIITCPTDMVVDFDLYEFVLNHVFDRFKMTVDPGKDHRSYAVGHTKVRKRLSTIEKAIESAFDICREKDLFMSVDGGIDFQIYKSSKSYELTNVNVDYINSSTRNEYRGKDIRMLDDRNDRYLWQNQVLDFLYDEVKEEFVEPDDRTIIWIQDKNGNTGKSKFVKWLCVSRPDEVVKVVFGSSSQLRSSLVSCGPKRVYFVDIPRTIGKDDQIENLLTILEDCKNGLITTNFYGRYANLIMDPPHVVVFANMPCPKKALSFDRWKFYQINNTSQGLKKIEV